ncbi:MAG: hypothetical protein HKN20_08790, partial [Gemmatimonadetes bacterium]|nr:hypothetical protein [Gemmatimonadota bacterium]
IYTLLLFAILACNGESVGRAFRALTSGRRPASATLGQRAKVTIAALVGMGMLFVCDQLLVNFFGHGAG